MATDIRQVVENLRAFHDLGGAPQGLLALERIAPFRDRRDIVIPMGYLAALL